MTRIPFPSLSGRSPRFLPAVLLTVLLTAPLAVPAPAFQGPSPESLRTRAEEYWRLLVSGDRFGASEFMRSEDRQAFLRGREQPRPQTGQTPPASQPA